MKIKDIITEARRNPDQNPKVSPYDVFIKRYETADEIAGVKNLFVSFTQIDKLGINPQSRYNTPIGIYAYNADYFKEVAKDMPSMLPFAGDQPFVNIFSVSGNIVNLGEMTSQEAVGYYQKLGKVYFEELQKSGLDKTWKDAVDELERIINDASTRAKIQGVGGHFWYVTMVMCAKFAEIWGTKKNAVAWNKMMRLIGIDGVVDEGNGIIHINEPNSAVFFNPTVIQDVDRVANKYSNAAKRFGQKQAEKSAKLNAMSDEELQMHIHDYPGDLKYVGAKKQNNTNLQIVAFTRSPHQAAENIKRPTPDFVRFVYKHNPMILYYFQKHVPDDVVIDMAHKGLEWPLVRMKLPFRQEKLFIENVPVDKIHDIIDAVSIMAPEFLDYLEAKQKGNQ